MSIWRNTGNGSTNSVLISLLTVEQRLQEFHKSADALLLCCFAALRFLFQIFLDGLKIAFGLRGDGTGVRSQIFVGLRGLLLVFHAP